MRPCVSCGHVNPDHLNYCFGCGRRVQPGAPAAFAPTVATRSGEGGAASPSRRSAKADRSERSSATLPARAWDALRFVFVYVRGRMDAEGRRRLLLSEREAAEGLIEDNLFGLGQIVVTEANQTAETNDASTQAGLSDLVDAVSQARKRREAAIADLASGERLQASEDLRLGIEQSTLETEWKACQNGAAAIDESLHKLEVERRQVEEQSGRETVDHARLALLDDQYRSLRERAAALRASTVAARAKYDHATAARRQAAAARVATLSAHARDRAEAERTIRELTIELGRRAVELRLPGAALASGYAQLARLEMTIAERDHQLAGVAQAVDRFDTRKLAWGLGLLAVLVAAIACAVWMLVV